MGSLRVQVPFFYVVYFSRGTESLPKKKRDKGTTLEDLVLSHPQKIPPNMRDPTA